MKEELCEKVVEVRMVSDRVITVVVLKEYVLRFICGYVLQSGRCFEEKHDELKGMWDMYSAGDFVVSLGDINGNIGRYIDGFTGAHGEYGFCL